MKRVVVTGIGILSPIGLNQKEVVNSLKEGKSGITFNQEFSDLGFRSCVSGTLPEFDIKEFINKKDLRFMAKNCAYATIALQQAIADANLDEEMVSNPHTGVIAGSGGTAFGSIIEVEKNTLEKGPKKVGPFMVPKTMGSAISANLATVFKIKGYNYSITSACSTSAHCVGNAYELIQSGKQKIMFAGGSEELHWGMAVQFDAMGALSSKHNDTPQKASRAYDQDRDGFVIAEGSGMVVLEEYEHAIARGAKIYAEIIGYGANSDGADMVAPSGEGAIRCMQIATKDLNEKIDYVNAHGTSTPVGDMKEIGAIKSVLTQDNPIISSTKSYTGHSLGATGVQELIYTLLMMENNFIAESINIENLDEEAEGINIATSRVDNIDINVAMSNSFGFGGTNATLLVKKVK